VSSLHRSQRKGRKEARTDWFELTLPSCLPPSLSVIGDEVLNGKTRDTNSNFFAKLCFDMGVDLKRIETIADDPEEIREAAVRMVKNYDWVVTTGGVGPTQ